MSGLFLKSVDPKVVEVVERNRHGRDDLRKRAFVWAEERGFDEVMMNAFAGRTYVTGLPFAPKGFGRWTQPRRGSSHPYRDNEDELKLLAALRHDADPVPGLPVTVHSVSDVHSGASYLMYPTPFATDGTAWVSYSHRIDPSDADKFGPQWVECLASEFHAAKDALADST